MEFKHFSHNHGLISYQMPQVTKILCSGCKFPGLGNSYVCWHCNYFLHEQCFRAPRSLTHPSHPLHPLTLVPYPTYSSGLFFCKYCNLVGNGFSYSCSKCEFDLHVHCAHQNVDARSSNQPQNTTCPCDSAGNSHLQNDDAKQNHYASGTQTYRPKQNNPHKSGTMTEHFSHPHAMIPVEIEQINGELCSACRGEISSPAYSCSELHCTFNLHKTCFESPTEIRHKSHNQHPLTLHAAPPYSHGFNCDACQKCGNSFVYNCATCSYDLHINCANLPRTVTRPDHKHNLTLYYSSPVEDLMILMCDVCKDLVHDKAWVYYCRKCDFGTHLECVASIVKKVSASTDDNLMNARRFDDVE